MRGERVPHPLPLYKTRMNGKGEGMVATENAVQIEHLSWSKLQTYLNCSRKFYYQYINKAPAEKKSASLILGSAVHTAIESIHEARIAGESLPSMVSIMNAFDAAWQEECQTGIKLHFSQDENADSLRHLGEKMLFAYLDYQSNNNSRSEVLGIEHESLFNLVSGLPLMKARMDLLEVQGRTLIITDFKTSKCSYSEQRVLDGILQVVVYALAVRGIIRELGITKVVPRLVVLTKGKKPKIQVLEPQVTQDDVARLNRMTLEIWDGIQKEHWMRQQSWMCQSCPFQQRCRSDCE